MTTDTTTDDRSSSLARVAEEAYVYLFPLLLMETTRRVISNVPAGVKPGFGPMNSFAHLRAFPPGDFKEVVRPNFDTLYSTLLYDVRDEPLVVSVPDSGGRYYMLPMLDMWSDVFAVIGSRTTGAGASHHAIVRPDWRGELPDGVGRIDAPTTTGWVIGRTQTNGPGDYEAVHRMQDGYRATPLSSWPGPDEPEAVEVDASVDMTTPPLDQVTNLSGREFFALAASLLLEHPPHLVDQPILARMEAIGLRPGMPFDVDALDEGVLAAIEGAPKHALERMAAAEPRLNPVVDGWSQPIFGMGVYGTDYLRRAVVARIGLGANLPEDAVYPVLYHDADGDPPVGERDYVLHFEADELPPVDAFWSVTMYDGEGFPVPNDLERYALGDRDPLRRNHDGSLDLHVRHTDPGGDRTANWLPAPAGPLGLTMRLYGPRPEILDGRWTPPALVRVHD